MEFNNNENKKACPFCGKEININAKKCRYCNNWLDEEILCPYCNEQIKKSAKKCRFCGEWLNNENQDTENETKSIEKDFPKKRKKGIAIIILLILLFISVICIGITAKYLYILPYNSDEIIHKVEDNLRTDYSNASIIRVLKSSISVLERNNRGYTCKASVAIDGQTANIKYSYTKVGFSDYNIKTKVILPDCYDFSVKDLLIKLIKESKGYSIHNTASDVTIEYASIKNTQDYEYSCEANVYLKAKPGKAFVINSWNLADASLKIKCNADYTTYFCENGYTTCVSLENLYRCENVEE